MLTITITPCLLGFNVALDMRDRSGYYLMWAGARLVETFHEVMVLIANAVADGEIDGRPVVVTVR